MRVLICGSRTFSSDEVINDTIRRLTNKHGAENLTLIHGAAKGADSLAAHYATVYFWHRITAYPADWDRYGKRAGYVRNQQMLDEGHPDLVLAFKDKAESRGTDMMVALARKAGVDTYVWTANA